MNKLFPSMGDNLRVILIGASGGIGKGFLNHFTNHSQISEIYNLSRYATINENIRTHSLSFDFTDEDNIATCAKTLSETGKFDIIIVATGLLHGDGIAPEKNMRALSHDSFLKSLEINTVGPALTAKHLLPLLHRDRKTIFAALSARVGSISDNRLGGWYAYRASKAALNMVLKTLSLEFSRRYPEAIIAGLHPGTVDTGLSAPFQGNVPEGKLFTPEFSTGKMITVMDALTSTDSGNLFAWDGQKIEF